MRTAGAIGTNFFHHGRDDFQQQARTVFDRAAVGVSALVGPVLDELLQQIAVRTVNFHAVEAGRNCVGRSLTEIVHDARQFNERQRTWLGYIDKSVVDEGFRLRANRRRRDRRSTARLDIGVRDASDVPELREDVPTLGVHGLGDLAPAGNLLRRV